MQTELMIVAAVIVGVFSSARLTRLVTQDIYPPVAKMRDWWDSKVSGDWGILAFCHWCAAPWVTGPILLWGWLSDLHWSWWLFNGWLAASYVASMIVERDEIKD